MSGPDPEKPFAEPWHATVLGLADLMVRQGHFTATDWAEALGAELAARAEQGAPDTSDTYYGAVLSALEKLSADQGGISSTDQSERKDAWKAAYLRTPHGAPVEL